jgi:hypothetical protein
MSYKQGYQGQQQFRQTLTFEDLLKIQIQKCLDAMSLNDLRGSAASVRVLANMLYSDMTDKDYLSQMQQLQKDYEVQHKKDAREREIRLRGASCPDVVPALEDLPGQDYWENALRICLDLCGRKGLLMKPTVDEPLP